jgi:FkbM family methyltransferase
MRHLYAAHCCALNDSAPILHGLSAAVKQQTAGGSAGIPESLRVNILIKILRVLAIPQYRAAVLRTRVAASTEHDRILQGLGLDTVVDIGANRGQFALCIRRLYPPAQIFSFEPLSNPARVYMLNFGSDPRAQFLQKAIAPMGGSSAMHVSRWDVSSSLLPFAQAQHDNFPFTEESGQETVTTSPLSECLDAASIAGCALLKIDVQGFELHALEGCGELLTRFRYVYVEVSFVELYVGQALATDVLKYLLNRGFKLMCVANLSYGRSERPIQADFLFCRSEPSVITECA